MLDRLKYKKAWIFDLDGTLAHSKIDFQALRSRLEIPRGQDILGHINQLSPLEAMAKHQLLNDLEMAYAKKSKAMPGAIDLLQKLKEAGVHLGILTRNHKKSANTTLKASGLAGFFESTHVLSREDAAPKPHPEGVKSLMSQFHSTPPETVMVGDFRFDVDTANAARVDSILVCDPPAPDWGQSLHVADLNDLLPFL